MHSVCAKSPCENAPQGMFHINGNESLICGGSAFCELDS